MLHKRIELSDGEAEGMGGGTFVIFQECEGEVVTVVLTAGDLQKLLASEERQAIAA